MILKLTFPVSDKSQECEFYKLHDEVWSAVKSYVDNASIKNTEFRTMLTKSHNKHRCTSNPPLPEDFNSLNGPQRKTVAGHCVRDYWKGEKIKPDDELYFSLI